MAQHSVTRSKYKKNGNKMKYILKKMFPHEGRASSVTDIDTDSKILHCLSQEYIVIHR